MLACIESMFGEQVFSHYNYFTLVPSKFSRQNESSPPPEMIDRNVIYIQVPGRDEATRTDGVVFDRKLLIVCKVERYQRMVCFVAWQNISFCNGQT